MNWTLLHAALLRALNSPVLDLILRVRDGRRVPDELEPGGRVGLQLEEVRGRGGSWKYFNILWRKYFNVLILLSSAISVTTRLSGKISGTFSNIWKFNKNHKSLNLNILSVSSLFPVCVCLCLCLDQPLILTPFHADSDILRVSTEEGREVPFSFLETTKKL